MGPMSGIAVAGVALFLVLAFLAGHCLETHRVRRLLQRAAIERGDLEERRQELEERQRELAERWCELAEQQHGFPSESMGTSRSRHNERRAAMRG